ncbi:hypothetical protein OPV22_024901 [Ensete ventricosum]|uniref:Uncharacterized protein n=1 Tax=Ensete ventricosum TaxID=4639 RepID=A0AAV8QI37_ENSVE|nr:hypothetical protein OPV22_024901 [Ensete ventricosum]
MGSASFVVLSGVGLVASDFPTGTHTSSTLDRVGLEPLHLSPARSAPSTPSPRLHLELTDRLGHLEFKGMGASASTLQIGNGRVHAKDSEKGEGPIWVAEGNLTQPIEIGRNLGKEAKDLTDVKKTRLTMKPAWVSCFLPPLFVAAFCGITWLG